MAEVRQRKASAPSAPGTTVDDNEPDKKTPPKTSSGIDVGILSVAAGVLTTLVLTALAIATLIYFLDPLQHLDDADANANANANNQPTTALPTYTPSTLRSHDGTDPTLPLLLALNSTVYDVSTGRPFYGPSGPYAHFAGRDATRAWITECFGPDASSSDDNDDSDAQLTPSLRNVHAMFLPLWLDEALSDAAAGHAVTADAAALFGALGTPAGTVLPAALRTQAQKALARMPGGGVVSEEERAERRVGDEREARAAVEAAVGKWAGVLGAKYPVVGVMEREEEEVGEPPALCEKARRKRPIKGGRLEPMMGMLEKLRAKGGGGGAGGAEGEKEMPEFVKQMLSNKEKK